ncbi:hypothetical protein DM01DRAFT_1120289 [Hesseltinella vesiculosa]|uniref:Uncharacterized protein n=1 Tax=Hesseltinella vesiculosa TaxID=101127 RepID=A0A1X2GTE3_9FUNG|nr:hypothetical protein DM01DRAFT_1120289 [Hesseltinella vesiculosa]
MHAFAHLYKIADRSDHSIVLCSVYFFFSKRRKKNGPPNSTSASALRFQRVYTRQLVISDSRHSPGQAGSPSGTPNAWSRRLKVDASLLNWLSEARAALVFLFPSFSLSAFLFHFFLSFLSLFSFFWHVYDTTHSQC